ncbi:MAG TPA: arylsulfatase [Gemmataceae bacterium]|nr:arylsulfatase [Gemmataceae bacterium]
MISLRGIHHDAPIPALFLAAILVLAPAQATALAAAPQKPNVIVFLADDNGYGDLACHGHPFLKTPNFDTLHSQSVRLTDFHVAPMCTPTRGQLMTGMDALHNGAASVSAGRTFIRRGIPTMAEIFAAGGYRTALYGKWHLGDSYPHLPHQRGFHDAVHHKSWGITAMPETWENDNLDGRFLHNGDLRRFPGYCTDVFFDLSMQWMKKCKEQNESFFVYLPTNAAHGPHWVPQKYKDMYRGKPQPAFFGMIANLDENLGRLDSFLHEQGLFENTILIYMNDNGGTAGVNTYNAGMRGRKQTYYEGGHRAACFVRWPGGGLRKPCDLDATTEVQDLLPTLIDLCGLQKPANARFDGASLANYLKGGTDALPDRLLVVQYGEQPNGEKLEKGRCAVMWNKWRLVADKELYDLKTDPGQKSNVASKHPDVAAKLRGHYERWWAAVEPGIDDFEPISIGADQENPVKLCAADWVKVYCDNMNNLREGLNRNGPWHLLVEKDGVYDIELRRWPKEADAAINAGVPAFHSKDGAPLPAGGLPAGKALPIAKARLKLGNVDERKLVPPGTKGVTFTVRLKGGTRTTLQTWFYDVADNELCGAYFAYVRRK